MSVERKEAYLKKRREYYHKRKAIVAASKTEVVHLDCTESTPHTKRCTQSVQPLSLGVSQICNTQMFRTPTNASQHASNQLFRTPTNASQHASNQLFNTPLVDVTQIASNQFGQPPMDLSQTSGEHMVVNTNEASQATYYGRNLLTSFQNVMSSPGKTYCCVPVK
jgi:hypothetical protein